MTCVLTHPPGDANVCSSVRPTEILVKSKESNCLSQNLTLLLCDLGKVSVSQFSHLKIGGTTVSSRTSQDNCEEES